MSASPPVALFMQCLIDAMYPEVGIAMVRIFDHLGIPTTFDSRQTCCGQPAFNSGYRREAKAAARHFLDVFAEAEVIVCASGSCVAMVRHHYPELFADDPILHNRACQIGNRTFELSQYLVDELGVTDLGSDFTGQVTYHESCHLARTLGIRDQPRTLLRAVPGLELIEMEKADTCCGFGGTFSVKYPAISEALVEDKVNTILATGADTVTGCDISCLMNIQGRLSRLHKPVRVRHLAEIIAGGVA